MSDRDERLDSEAPISRRQYSPSGMMLLLRLDSGCAWLVGACLHLLSLSLSLSLPLFVSSARSLASGLHTGVGVLPVRPCRALVVSAMTSSPREYRDYIREVRAGLCARLCVRLLVACSGLHLLLPLSRHLFPFLSLALCIRCPRFPHIGCVGGECQPCAHA
jgi:hypothetical protein